MSVSKEKLFGLLTICRKAGRMTMGFDSVKESILTDKAKAVFLPRIYPQNRKRSQIFADQKAVPVHCIDATIAEIEFSVGRKAGVIGICDEGFAKKLTELIG